MTHRGSLLALAFCFLVLAPSTASAFCGFYVGGAGTDLFNDATQVALMRDGDRTILSMENRYDGPIADFAMVVPVPQVLMQANVKTLDASVFRSLDRQTAPRLVEYWEQDPCFGIGVDEGDVADLGFSGVDFAGGDTGVTVEAQFQVGEYEIVILSAVESTGLDAWLAANNYNVPAGAAPYYQPYIDAGMYFFVAQVDPAEVTFAASGRAVLSPLRFDFTATEFFLPIRLGMINSGGTQDLIVYTLGRAQRYELANYPNVLIPTDLEVIASTSQDFGAFYTGLFARTLKQNPGAIVTEYAWAASSCDPCPGATLSHSEILTLGADVLGDGVRFDSSWVVTRLHARYHKDEVGEDLVFQAAPPVTGGRGAGVMLPAAANTFQGRYIIRHPWAGAVDCSAPQFEQWGRGGTQTAESPNSSGADVDDSGESSEIGSYLVDDAPEIGVTGTGERERGTSPTGGPQGDGGRGDVGVPVADDGMPSDLGPTGSATDTAGGAGPRGLGAVRGNTCTTAGSTPGMFGLVFLLPAASPHRRRARRRR